MMGSQQGVKYGRVVAQTASREGRFSGLAGAYREAGNRT